MRDAFIRRLTEMAREDDRIFLVVGDLGFSVIEPFAEEFPDRFLNAGVAEQTMLGAASGLAASGYTVFVYSIGNFPTMRCLEQIRNDVCYHRRSVTVVAVGSGYSYGSLGYTHHAIEDIAVMRALPHMTVLSPCDPLEARALTGFAAELGGPAYLRLGKNGEPALQPSPSADLTAPHLLAQGDDVTVLATGSIASVALEAAEGAKGTGLSLRVVSVPVVNPLSTDALRLAEGTRGIVTLEEHSLRGGFGSAVLELAAMSGWSGVIKPIAIGEDQLGLHVGSTEYLRRANGLTADAVTSRAREVVDARVAD